MEIKVVGGSCGQHGSCTFFKGLRVVLPTTTTTTINNNNNNINKNNSTSTTTLTTVATSRLSLNNNNANNKQNNSIKSKDCNNKTLNNSTNGNNLNGKRGAGISSVSSDVSDNDNKILNGNDSCESDKLCEVITCDKSNEMKREPLELKVVEENTSSSNSKTLILALGDCIPVRPWSDSPIECLAEIRMIWKDKTEQCLLISLRLYFLPENTPLGRNCHGEDELVAVNDRVILRVDDFSSWVVGDLKWNWGLVASFNGKPTVKLITSANGLTAKSLLSNTKLDFSEVEKEKISVENIHTNVTVLSFSRYCRYRATLKRLEGVEDEYIRTKLIETLSGFVASQPNTRIMFCKESIDYPDLESHEMLCLHLAPKLKGRPRGRRKKVNQISECSSPPPSSEYSVDSCETNDSDAFSEKRGVSGTPGKKETKKEKELRGNQRVTRTKTKSESSTNKENQINEKLLYTTLSTGRVTKQRMQITPSKSTNTRKRTKNTSAVSDEEDESSDDEDDNEEDEDYDDKYINRKLKQESGGNGSGTKRQNSSNSGNEDKIKIEKDLPKSVPIPPMSQLIPINLDIVRSIEEQEFMARLNKFMSERAYAYPKLIWSLRDVNLYTIYARVQKLGGFDKIADNRVWKNLFEDLVAPNGGSVAQGMTKRKYERILLPFERYERELRNHFDSNHSEITISTVSKSHGMNGSIQGHSIQIKQRSNSPAIEIIPIKNGNGSENHELTKEQMTEIQNIIKHKDNTVSYHSLNGNSSDGISVPVTVIVRPQANNNNNNNNNSGDDQNNTLRSKYNENGADGRAFGGLEAEHYYNNKLLRHSRGKQDRRIPYSPNSPRNSTNSPQQAPSEKENIPMMLSKQSTTIVPLNRDGMPASGFGNDVIELVDSDDDSGRAGSSMRTSGPMKKRKLDILREGGLEVTPISRGQMENLLMMIPSGMQGEPQQNQHPKISMTTLPPRAAPPIKFQSMNMYQTTTKIFGNPKDFMPITTMKPVGNYQPPTTSRDCLDLTVSPTRKRTLAQAGIQLPEHLSIVEKRKPTLEEMQRSYRGGNPDLQITLVKAQQYRPNGMQPGNSGITQPKKYQPKAASERKSKASSTTQMSSSIPPLNPTLIAAANELQKRNMLSKSLMFPTNSFLPGIDITPSHSMASHLPQSAATSTTMASKMQAPKMNHHMNSTPPPQSNSGVPSSFLSLLDPIYLSALYAANPSFLNFQNSLPPELLKFYQNSIPAQSVPSSKS